MPITAEKVIKIITLAANCVEHTNRLREGMKLIVKDTDDLLAMNPKEQGELMLDIIASMKSSAADVTNATEISTEELQNLYYEKAKFEINAKKNKNAATRMRLMRGMRKETESENERESLPVDRPLSREEITKRLKGISQEAGREIETTLTTDENWLPKEKEEK